MDLEGLFRKSGSTNLIKDFRTRIDNGLYICNIFTIYIFMFFFFKKLGEQVDINEIEDPHAVSGLLKLFLREMSKPLLTYTYYNDWLSIIGMLL